MENFYSYCLYLLVLLIKYFSKFMCDAPLPIGRLEFTTKLTLVDLELRSIFHSIKVYFIFLVIAAIPTTYITDSSSVPMLIGDNYNDWKESIIFSLGCMDLDLALRVDESPVPTESSAPNDKLDYEQWERFNRLSLMFIKSHINKNIRGSVPECNKVKDFMKAIEE